MTKITPVQSTTLEEKKTGIEGLLQEEETSSSYEEKDTKERNVVLRFILSIRLFLIAMITLVVLLTAISIWVTAYTMNEQASLEQVDVIITNMNEKMASFVNGQLITAKYVADSMVSDYYNGYIDMVDTIRPYLFERIKTLGITVTNFCFGEQGHNSLFAFSVAADGISLSFGTKRQNENLIIYKANMTTGEYYPDKMTSNLTYSVFPTDYYTESIALMKKYPNGAFGAPYKVLIGPQSTYWSTPIYNKTELPEKKTRIGFAKINISLAAIAQFLSTVKVMEKGYVIISEYGNNFVIGSSLKIAGVDETRIRATNITTRGAGTVMTKLLKYQTDNMLNTTARFSTSLTNDNGESFLVSSSPYTFHNLQWRMTIVFDKPRSSIFSEANSIYSSLTETVNWLSEIRAFLPESVLNQLEMTRENSAKTDNTFEPGMSFQASSNTLKRAGESKLNVVDDSFDKQSKISKQENTGASSLFKLGLSIKDCSVIFMTVPNLDEEHFEYESGLLSTLISKALTSISTICKTCKADFQIKSHNEFVIVLSDKNPAVTALETSLKIATLLNSLNESLTKDGRTALKMCASVTSGNTIMGNVGSKQMRYFAMIGPVVNRAKQLNEFSKFLDVQVVCDQVTQQKAKDSFVYRPVERIIDRHNIQTVYQLVKRNVVHDDEWLYELEQKKANAKFDQYNADFNKVFESEHALGKDDMELILSHLVESSQNNPHDLVIKRLEQIFSESKLKGEDAFFNYHTSVGNQFVSFIRPGETLHSSMTYNRVTEE